MRSESGVYAVLRFNPLRIKLFDMRKPLFCENRPSDG